MCFGSPLSGLPLRADQAKPCGCSPSATAVFLDIISQGECCCKACLAYMKEHGLDASKPEDRQACSGCLARSLLSARPPPPAAATTRTCPSSTTAATSPRATRGILQLLQPPGARIPAHGRVGLRSLPAVRALRRQARARLHGHDRQVPHDLGRVRRLQAPERAALRVRADAGERREVLGRRPAPSQRPAWTKRRTRSSAKLMQRWKSKEPWCDGVKNVADIAVLSSEAEARAPVASADVGVGPGSVREPHALRPDRPECRAFGLQVAHSAGRRSNR